MTDADETIAPEKLGNKHETLASSEYLEVRCSVSGICIPALVRPFGCFPPPGRDGPEDEKMTDSPRSASPWTPEEDALLRSMAAAGESVAAIMKLLKRTEAAIRNRAWTLKIKFARAKLGRRPKGETLKSRRDKPELR